MSNLWLLDRESGCHPLVSIDIDERNRVIYQSHSFESHTDDDMQLLESSIIEAKELNKKLGKIDIDMSDSMTLSDYNNQLYSIAQEEVDIVSKTILRIAVQINDTVLLSASGLTPPKELLSNAQELTTKPRELILETFDERIHPGFKDALKKDNSRYIPQQHKRMFGIKPNHGRRPGYTRSGRW